MARHPGANDKPAGGWVPLSRNLYVGSETAKASQMSRRFVEHDGVPCS